MSVVDFNRAISCVQRELRQLDLDELVDRVEIEESWSIANMATCALGLFQPGSRRSRIIGSIAIPALNLPFANGIAYCARAMGLNGTSRSSLRFVVRHEYAHGLAHLLGLLDNTGMPWGYGTCFTEYATTNADEDLAETVALFLTRHGRPPCDLSNVWLRSKWVCAARLIHQTQHRNRKKR